MATMNVRDADGNVTAVEKPSAPGRTSAAASRPVALSTEDLAALTALATGLTNILSAIQAEEYYPATQTVSGTVGVSGTVAVSAAALPLPAGATTAAKQDLTIAAINNLAGPEYETVAASQTNQTLGGSGATGDLLTGVLVIPATTSPGAIAIKDGGNTAITVFAGGASSISSLHPFFIPLGARSGAGAWQLTTGANVSAIAVGNFT